MAGLSSIARFPWILLVAISLISPCTPAALLPRHRQSPRGATQPRGGPDTAYVPPQITFHTVYGAPNVGSDTYDRLTGLMPTVLQNALSITDQSWELGTLVEAILEVYYPATAPFEFTCSSLTANPPYEALKVVVNTMAEYDWSASPSASSNDSSVKGGLGVYLDSDTSPTPLSPRALLDGAGALGDPCAVGPGAWTLATFLTRGDVGIRLKMENRTAKDYAWAVGNQLQYLMNGPKSDNGTISQRENQFQLWADMGYMIPPFLASLGMSANKTDLLETALDQWLLESSALLDTTKNIFRHINDFDARLWATGNAWMLYGICRVLASIDAAGQTSAMQSKVDNALGQISKVFPAIFSLLDKDNLVPNYMLETDGSLNTGDAAGTALIVAAYYRFATLSPWSATSDLTNAANRAFDGVVNQLKDDGWLGHLVDPQGTQGWVVNLKTDLHSPEGQSFLAHMWAARTAFEQ